MSKASAIISRFSELWHDAAAFLEWWRSELAGLLPGWIRSRLRLVPEFTELRLVDAAIELNHVSAEGRIALGSFGQDESEAPLLLDALAAAQKKDRRLVLMLTGHDVLARDIAMPAAVEENLAQVLQFEMDRYTPFKAETVYSGFHVLRREPQHGRIIVRLVAVPRAVLDYWLPRLQAWGIRPDRVEAEGAPGVDLAPAAREKGAGRSVFTLRNVSSFLIIVLLVVLSLIPLWKMREVVIHVNQEVARVLQSASMAQKLRAERDELLNRSRYLIRKKEARHPVIAVLDELSRILPDDTWLISLKYSDESLVIRGHSSSASNLIGLIDASPIFDSVSFVAPVTRDRSSGQDIFQIALDVKEKPS